MIMEPTCKDGQMQTVEDISIISIVIRFLYQYDQSPECENVMYKVPLMLY